MDLVRKSEGKAEKIWSSVEKSMLRRNECF